MRGWSRCGGSRPTRSRAPRASPRWTGGGTRGRTSWPTLRPGGSGPRQDNRRGTTLGWRCSERSREPSPPSWTRRREGARRPQGGTRQAQAGVGRPAHTGASPGRTDQGLAGRGDANLGPHLMVASAAGGYRCIHCSRHATSHQARRAMVRLSCRERPGLKPHTMGGVARERWNAGIGRAGTVGTITCSMLTPGRTAATSAWTADATASSGGSSSPSRAPGCRRDPSTRARSNRSRRDRS